MVVLLTVGPGQALVFGQGLVLALALSQPPLLARSTTSDTDSFGPGD